MRNLWLPITAVVFAGAASAHADMICPSAQVPDPTPMRLSVYPDGTGQPIATAGSTFPAISEDGHTIVMWFDDAEDFSDEPRRSLIFWNSDGTRPIRVNDPAAANARLARKTWLALASTTACGTDPDVTQLVARFDGGPTLSYDVRSSTLIRTDGAAHARVVRLPAIGWRGADQGIPAGPCGVVTEMWVAWSPSTQVAIVMPSGNLGGDSCVGTLGADRAIMVSLR